MLFNKFDIQYLRKFMINLDFEAILNYCDVHWSFGFKSNDLDEVYRADNKLCEKLEVIENKICRNENEHKLFCDMVINYLSNIEIRSIIIKSKGSLYV